MDNAEHTPGPWKAETEAPCPNCGHRSDDFYSIWYDNEGGVGAEIAGRIGEEANARLIAAAPELLEAAKKGLSDLENCAAAGEGLAGRKALRNAIAKAEGESDA